MSDEVLVEVRNVSKKYCMRLKSSLIYGVRDLVGELMGRRLSDELRKNEFWAVKNVSFTLRRGDALGIIGPNGAGKSTLLKMLNGLIKPNTGSIRMRGRVRALIELGSGFNPILTGRENIFINASVLGIPKEEVEKRLDQIIEFAEIGDFIDTPVKNYSSGMKVRLGFSIAIYMRPDVLIIDEVLAVGDQRFRRKARNAMSKLLESDIALIFVSHNIHEVLGITQKTLWIDKGEVVKLGDTSQVCAEYVYHSTYDKKIGNEIELQRFSKCTGDMKVIEVVTYAGRDPRGRYVEFVGPDSDLTFELTLQAFTRIDEPVWHLFSISTLEGEKIGYVVINDSFSVDAGKKVCRRFKTNVDYLHPGVYQVSYELGTEGGPTLEGVENLIYLDIKPRKWRISDKKTELNYARMLGNRRGSLMLPITYLSDEDIMIDNVIEQDSSTKQHLIEK